MSELVIRNVRKSYFRVEALKGIGLSISPGIFGLLGPNGSGKTTLMRILTRLIVQDEGEISLGDITWNEKNRRDIQAMIGYLPQNFSFYPYLTVREALDYVALMKNVPRSRAASQIEEAVGVANLEAFLSKKIRQLSGGMLRRFGIAQAIIGAPRVMVVDEPTAGLDPEERVRFRNLLWKLSTDRTVILSTHIVQDIEAICDQVAILKEGQVLVSGTPEALVQSTDGYVRTMVADAGALQELSKKNEIVSYSSHPDGIHVRYLSARADTGTEVSPTLEDAYLRWIKGDRL